MVFAILATDRGDVVELLDAQGTPFAAYRYDPWGNPQGSGNVGVGVWIQSTALIGETLATDIATRQPLRYAGYFYDSESGFYYLSARSYDPKTAQFLSKDPIDSDGEESPYQYCSGNPVSLIDPSGLLTLEGLFGGISAGFARLFDLGSPLGGLVRGLERHLEKMSARASHIPGGRTTSLMELLRSNSSDQLLAAMLATTLEAGNYDDAAYILTHGFGLDVTGEELAQAMRYLDEYTRNAPQPGATDLAAAGAGGKPKSTVGGWIKSLQHPSCTHRKKVTLEWVVFTERYLRHYGRGSAANVLGDIVGGLSGSLGVTFAIELIKHANDVLIAGGITFKWIYCPVCWGNWWYVDGIPIAHWHQRQDYVWLPYPPQPTVYDYDPYTV